jgi:hypothetical protein
LVVAFNSVAVALLFTPTVAPGITAPEASLTVPMIEDAVEPPWAHAVPLIATLIIAAISQLHTTLNFIFHTPRLKASSPEDWTNLSGSSGRHTTGLGLDHGRVVAKALRGQGFREKNQRIHGMSGRRRTAGCWGLVSGEDDALEKGGETGREGTPRPVCRTRTQGWIGVTRNVCALPTGSTLSPT